MPAFLTSVETTETSVAKTDARLSLTRANAQPVQRFAELSGLAPVVRYIKRDLVSNSGFRHLKRAHEYEESYRLHTSWHDDVGVDYFRGRSDYIRACCLGLEPAATGIFTDDASRKVRQLRVWIGEPRIYRRLRRSRRNFAGEEYSQGVGWRGRSLRRALRKHFCAMRNSRNFGVWNIGGSARG